MGGECVFIRADVTKRNDIKRLISKTKAEFGKLDILYNNVAIQLYKGIENTSEKDWDKAFATNIKSYFLCSTYSIPEMERVGKGIIINTGSVLSFVVFGNDVAYVSSKHAILGLTKAMAIDLAPKNIRVVAICPGTTDAGLYQGYLKSNKEINLEEIGKMQLPNRIGKPEEIANVAVFLASENSNWIIGTPVIVDGGSMAK